MGGAVRSVIEEASAAGSIVALNSLFRRRVLAAGFDTYAVGSLTGPAPTFFMLEWPRSWLELYAHQGFGSEDVVVAEAMRRPDPFSWSEIRLARPEASARIFAAAETFGWQDGLAVPIHGPNGERGVVSLAAKGPIVSAAMAPVVALSLAAYERAKALTQPAVLDRSRKGLSRREREAIALVADGLNDEEIAARMGVARSTAHYHVEQGRRKLGAATRAHAVALALALRAI